MHSPTDRLGLPVAIRHAEGSDTMLAWDWRTGGGGSGLQLRHILLAAQFGFRR
jgi:hypothetical protein